MKRLILVVLMLALLVSVGGCVSTPQVAPQAVAANTPQAAAPQAAGVKGLKVASINWTNAHGWRSTYDAQLKEVADKYIAEGVISKYQALTPNQDPALELQYFQQSINDGYDIILINAGGSSGLDTAFEQAAAKGILVVPVDNIYPYPNV